MKKIESGNLNIITIITSSDIGGAQIHVKDIAVALQAYGNKITVLVGSEDPEFPEMLKELNIPCRIVNNLVRNIDPKKDFKAYKEIRQIMQEIKPDLVTLHSSKAGILGRLAVYFEKIPSTFTVHGWVFTNGENKIKQIIYRNIERIGALFPTHLIAVSHYDGKIGLQQKVCKSNNITVIQNGMPDIKPALMAKAENEPPKLIMIARFAKQKDHVSLIEALAELRELPWELNLVGGDGGLLAQTEDKIKSLHLNDKIHILGYRSDIDELISNSQIFVLSSNWEGLPLSIIEAMRAKLPVIASDVGGVNELIVNDETGYLINSKKDLVYALKTLITNSDKRQDMGNKGRDNYDKYFNLNIQLEKTFDLYNKLLNQNKN